MKTLGKLKINTEKILKNEELVQLRGGYDEYGGTGGCADNKKDACTGKTDGADCCWTYNGTTYNGKCGTSPITFEFHCVS